MTPSNINRGWRKAARKFRRIAGEWRDWFKCSYVRLMPGTWPCQKRQYLVVGCESSGTTAIANLLFNDGNRRFLLGGGSWAWKAYQEIYQGKARIRDYPRLQLYDGLKVPGFAAILDHYVEAFPNCRIVYVVRDPRDVVASAYRSKGARTREELASISWVAEDWLGIPSADPVARMAHRWKRYLEVASQVSGVQFVRYEDFCADKVGVIKSLAERLQVHCDLDRARAEADRQASHPSVRNYVPRGPGNGRADFVTSDDEHIIESICGDWMTRWNYMVSANSVAACALAPKNDA